jgi:hypothetical protein
MKTFKILLRGQSTVTVSAASFSLQLFFNSRWYVFADGGNIEVARFAQGEVQAIGEYSQA